MCVNVVMFFADSTAIFLQVTLRFLACVSFSGLLNGWLKAMMLHTAVVHRTSKWCIESKYQFNGNSGVMNRLRLKVYRFHT